MKIGVFEIKSWEEEYLRSHLPDQQIVFSNQTLNQSTLPSETDFDIISVFADSRIDKNVINHFPSLKLIATRTTGIDHIDSATAAAKNVSVKNVPTYGENTVAEYTFALLLNLSRKISKAAERVKQRGSFSSEGLDGFDLLGKTIGVVGTGHIGQHVIKIAKGFDMNVLAFEVNQKPELAAKFGFQYTDFENLLKNSDIITLHVPYLDSTHHMINKNNISLIKKGAILINTARGSIVETEAIVKALADGTLAAVALDVLEEETNLKNTRQLILERELDDEDLRTILSNHILIDMDNVLITPHNAFNTREALIRILNKTIENIKSLL